MGTSGGSGGLAALVRPSTDARRRHPGAVTNLGRDGYATLAQGDLQVDQAAGPLLANTVATALKAQGSIAPRIEGRAVRSP
ncbi:hypothetical protein ACFOGJ_07505 [Marinibaculum pumilum]|uniref:Uncharacterized protein n=1 Tax=Marinibaculum pumilum TaxID=1766165 RepID=A0ABV7KY61_9PROT